MNKELITEANRMKREGKIDRAISLYQQLISINPNFAWAHYSLGDALAKEGKLDMAVACYSKSLEINPNSAWFCYNLGCALAQQGKLEEAVEFLQKAVDIQPSFDKFSRKLSQVLTQLNNGGDASSSSDSQMVHHYTGSSGVKPILTIGIPTYNRCEAVVGNVTHLQKSGLPENVKILVIDNASPDKSYESLLKICNPAITRVLKNNENIGVAKNIFRLFRECDSEYLIYTSDEDYIVTENIEDFLQFITTTSADFISPQAIVKDKVYRGRENSRVITPSEYRHSCNYASGITYKVSSCLSKLEKIETYIDRKFEMAITYSHVLLSAMVILSGSAYWYNKPLCHKVFNLTSENHSKIGPYTHVTPRWYQYSSQIDFFLDLLNDPEYYSLHEQIKEMLEYHLSTLGSFFYSAISNERRDIPGLAVYLNHKDKKIDIIKQGDRYHFTILK